MKNIGSIEHNLKCTNFAYFICLNFIDYYCYIHYISPITKMEYQKENLPCSRVLLISIIML